jgi:hypothetical protein
MRPIFVWGPAGERPVNRRRRANPVLGPAKRLLYLVHVIAYDSVDDLAAALKSVEEDAERRLVEQLLSVSRLVRVKDAMTRKA